MNGRTSEKAERISEKAEIYIPQFRKVLESMKKVDAQWLRKIHREMDEVADELGVDRDWFRIFVHCKAAGPC